MLRSEYLPRRAGTYFTLPSRFLALSLGIALAGCSADVSRFDYPMFGLTESGNRIASAPIPRESVLGQQSAPSSSFTPRSHYEYDTYSRGASVPSGNYAGYAPSTESSQAVRNQPTYNQSMYGASRRPQPYQASNTPYQQAPSVENYNQRSTYKPQFGPQDSRRVAALPPAASTPAVHAAPKTRTSEQKPKEAAERNSGGNSRVIEVQPGDTLFSLAQRHGASLSELMSINGLTSPSVRPGQKILLPEAPSAIAASVRQGPARDPQPTRVAATTEHASASEPEDEQPVSSAIDDPSPSATTSQVPEVASRQADVGGELGETYTIRRGESLYSIAVRYGVPLDELKRINGITDPRRVKAGTVLKLPTRHEAPLTAIASTPERQPEVGPQQVSKVANSAPASAGSAANPVIINAPRQTVVASLEDTRKMSDVAPAGPATQPEASPSNTNSAERTVSEDAKWDSAAAATSKFRWPVRGKVIGSFGKQPDGSYSEGIKLSVPAGTEVHAAESGVVVFAGDQLKDYGNLVLLRHDDGWITAYAHNAELNVKRGDRVRRGQVIAKAGNTGSADRPLLHFELRKGSSPVDPIPHLESL